MLRFSVIWSGRQGTLPKKRRPLKLPKDTVLPNGGKTLTAAPAMSVEPWLRPVHERREVPPFFIRRPMTAKELSEATTDISPSFIREAAEGGRMSGLASMLPLEERTDFILARYQEQWNTLTPEEKMKYHLRDRRL